MTNQGSNLRGLVILPAFLKDCVFHNLFGMRNLDSAAPDFDYVAEAFDSLRRNNSSTPFRVELSQEQYDKQARSLDVSLPANEPLAPKLHEENEVPASPSSYTECPKVTYTIRKLTEEEMAADNELQLATYTRGFDAEWTDVEDILTYKCWDKYGAKKIILFMVKGRDFDWVWLPATCVPVRVIEAFFQGGRMCINDISSPTTAERDDSTLTIWKVRQSTRGHFGLKNVLEIARFADLEEANACAKHHFKLHWVPGTPNPNGKYRFGNRFLGM